MLARIRPLPLWELPFAEKINKLTRRGLRGMRRHRSFERDFPHIVEIVVPGRSWGGPRDAMHNFHARHGLQARPRFGRYKDGGRYVRWYFADRDIAEAFAAKFAKGIVPLKTPTRVIYASRWSEDFL
jgi:hypothetical protein